LLYHVLQLHQLQRPCHRSTTAAGDASTALRCTCAHMHGRLVPGC
jgi:hypothetical protein